MGAFAFCRKCTVWPWNRRKTALEVVLRNTLSFKLKYVLVCMLRSVVSVYCIVYTRRCCVVAGDGVPGAQQTRGPGGPA